MLRFAIPIVTLFSLPACVEIREPEPIDPDEFLGCYQGSGLMLEITENAVSINGETYPYEITNRRIGQVVSLPLKFRNSSGALVSEVSDIHLYRFGYRESRRFIVIADQSAVVHELMLGPC